MKRSHVSLLCFSIRVARETDGCSEEQITGENRVKEKKKSSPHERTSRPVEKVGEGEPGSLIDVLCDLGLRHTHMEMTPRPAQRSRQSMS